MVFARSRERTDINSDLIIPSMVRSKEILTTGSSGLSVGKKFLPSALSETSATGVEISIGKLIENKLNVALFKDHNR